jgi:NTE family protein
MIEPTHSGRALVLGGGGSAGNAWMIGFIAGLYDAGVDVTDADLTIGTSAGSTTAAQLCAASPRSLLDGILDTPSPAPRPATAGADASGQARGAARTDVGARHLERLHAMIAASEDVADWRRRTTRTLAADPASGEGATQRWRSIVEARLLGATWPRRRIALTAVDVATAEPTLFDRATGIDLVDAVAASCAGGFAYRIGGRSYIDGGYRANADNADLATGYARILVLSPLGGRSFTPVAWGTHLVTQVESLRAEGSAVETVFPDADALAAFGDDMMSPAARPGAARAGYAHGLTAAPRVEELWM